MPTARPPAKINLTLAITDRRPDGYHELESVFLRVGLADRLTVAPATGATDRLTITGLPGVPLEGNLVLRALDTLRSYAGVHLPPLDISLDKQIPAGAGLGGGSSDAASALKLGQVAWAVRIGRADELSLAESLGSDVPFFYFDMPAAFVRGRGEELSALPNVIGSPGVVLVHPPFPLATPRVFARFDDLAAPPRARPHIQELIANEPIESRFLDELSSDELVDWAAATPEPNDLWPAAVSLEPQLGALRRDLESATNHRWLMSGSGSTLFALYPSIDTAVEAARSNARDVAAVLDGCRINVVDLVGPDPAWRFP